MGKREDIIKPKIAIRKQEKARNREQEKELERR
jgi:hypothetical protein